MGRLRLHIIRVVKVDNVLKTKVAAAFLVGQPTVHDEVYRC
jgi:hypothetical protein